MSESDNTSEVAVKEKGKPGTPFPYYDLGDAIRVARIIHEKCGGSCGVDQLAAVMGQSPASGAFRLRLSALVQFGLIRRTGGRIYLTELGERTLQDLSLPEARLDAFFSVGLFRRVFEAYQGKILPSAQGLQSKLKELGVVEGQVDRTRQILMRSAEVAGLFGYGKDRLVKPNLPPTRVFQEPTPVGQPSNSSESPPVPISFVHDAPAGLHPAISGMLDELPERGTNWSSEGLQQWLDALGSVLKVVYKVRPSTSNDLDTNG